jgi:hypothetical protein
MENEFITIYFLPIKGFVTSYELVGPINASFNEFLMNSEKKCTL